jgi:predicted HicB family RNase H-like nuclease
MSKTEVFLAMSGNGDPTPVAPTRKEYSGRFNVRIDRRIHRALTVEAAQAGVSLNALVAQKLRNPAHGFSVN